MEKPLMAASFAVFDLEAENREEVMRVLAARMNQDERLKDLEGYVEDVKAREAQSSTAVGMGVATPHAKSVHVRTPSLAFARLCRPIDWDGNEQVELVFQIAVPSPGQGDLHLKIISALFRKLVYPEFLGKLKRADRPETVLELIGEMEQV
ncbi:MAG: PTS sugar transporter subunit IIA [Eubacteriales bacterium]|nr:PTS sugar transporter subunit IIA [Eubacteriales bacterium]